ncbi:MAG: hypothetical protein Kow00104_01930 [Rhodothalassiaceae bacterium]
MIEASSAHLRPDWLDILILLCVTAMVAFLLQPRISRASDWRATVTPLASIIGSGFLVVAPLMVQLLGGWAVAAMTSIALLAFLVGSAVRYNIRHVEPISSGSPAQSGMPRLLWRLERLSDLVLFLAYIIAVAFYLEILAAFVLRLAGISDSEHQKAIASAILVLLAIFGSLRGFGFLEKLEEYAVSLKLAVIAGLLIGLAVHDAEGVFSAGVLFLEMPQQWSATTLRHLAGMFLMVQGFEVSRYLGDVYGPQQRVQTMRRAQILSGAIYVLFVALALPTVDMSMAVSETTIIDLSRQVAITLPYLLVLGAVMSQFSAAIADLVGSGGTLGEAIRRPLPNPVRYPAVAGLAILLLWSVDIYAIIAWASRAFAVYYMLQAVMAALHAAHQAARGERRATGQCAFFALLSLVMLAIALFALPADAPAG